MKLWAISDLHISHAINRDALGELPAYPSDWLILAGDATNGTHTFEWCLRLLRERFAKVIWVPGNHELWTPPGRAGAPRGEALYDRLVEIARACDVLTPEDPFPVFSHAGRAALVAPLFLLYDYSFRPPGVPRAQAVSWAREHGIVCSDEYYLHPDPYRERSAWCQALCDKAEARLEACPTDVPKVLVSHFPLEERLAVLPRVPRFTIWCGTKQTHGWHRRFGACAAVYGHLHIRGTTWVDGVPFQEVSLGYPSNWRQELGVAHYLREVEMAPRVRLDPPAGHGIG